MSIEPPSPVREKSNRGGKALAFFVSVSLLLSVLTWKDGMSSPLLEPDAVTMAVYRSDLGEGSAIDHALGLVAEPHRETTLALSSEDTLAWLVDGSVPNRGTRAGGREALHVFSMPGEASVVSVTARRLGRTSTAYEFTVYCKYVRRELRSLSSKDREDFLAAMRVLWDTETSAGKAWYGDAYRGIEYFAQKHLRGAAAPVCDHWHDGAGVATHHSAFSLEFEQSLQAVNPEALNFEVE